ERGTPLIVPKNLDRRVDGLAFEGSGTRLVVAVSSDHPLLVWDLANGTVVEPDGFTPDTAVDASDQVIVTGEAKGIVQVRDATTGSLVRSVDASTLGAGTPAPGGLDWDTNDVAISPDGRLAVTGHDLGAVLWDLVDGRGTRLAGAGQQTASVEFSPDGSHVA